VRDLQSPEARAALAGARHTLRGFTEADEPNFTFRAPPCSFYSGTKALAEELLRGLDRHYVWRLRIPFDEQDNPRNYLTKLQAYPRVYDNANSLSHRRDFARACLDLWERRAPFGTYNVTNPGFVTARDVVTLIERYLRPARPFEFFASDEEFYQLAARTPRSNCILDVSKLLATGVQLRPVEEALVEALKNWRPQARPGRNASQA
jgi:UDP-glucose 4,6-dehydratase